MIWDSLHNYKLRKIDEIDTTMSTFVYLLLAALRVSTLFLGHPQYSCTPEDDPGKGWKYIVPPIAKNKC
jgi:hypothetical protein